MHEVLGPSGPRVRAQFDPAALDTMLDLAANAPAGVRTLRAYLTTFQATLATTGASRIASGAIPASAANDFLAEAMQDAGRLEGVFATHVGHRAEEHGRDRDEELTRWVQGLGATVQFGIGVAAGPVTSAVVGPAVGPVADELSRRVATNEAQAEVDAERLAQDAADRLLYLWDRELVEHDVLDAGAPRPAARQRSAAVVRRAPGTARRHPRPRSRSGPRHLRPALVLQRRRRRPRSRRHRGRRRRAVRRRQGRPAGDLRRAGLSAGTKGHRRARCAATPEQGRRRCPGGPSPIRGRCRQQ